jgi:F1F0 ATPase subunit 2
VTPGTPSLLWEALGGAVVGAVAALLHLGGLWWTVRRLEGARRSPVLLVVSSLVRMLLVAGLLVAATGGRPAALLGALVGLAATRLVVVRRGLHPRAGPPGGRGMVTGP